MRPLLDERRLRDDGRTDAASRNLEGVARPERSRSNSHDRLPPLFGTPCDRARLERISQHRNSSLPHFRLERGLPHEGVRLRVGNGLPPDRRKFQPHPNGAYDEPRMECASRFPHEGGVRGENARRIRGALAPPRKPPRTRRVAVVPRGLGKGARRASAPHRSGARRRGDRGRDGAVARACGGGLAGISFRAPRARTGDGSGDPVGKRFGALCRASRIRSRDVFRRGYGRSRARFRIRRYDERRNRCTDGRFRSRRTSAPPVSPR